MNTRTLVSPTRLRHERIGFYGCARGNRVVSVSITNPPKNLRHQPRLLRGIACPACGEEHDADVTWRALTEQEAKDEKKGEVLWTRPAQS